MTTNKEWLDDLASNDIPALEAWMQAEHMEGYPTGHESFNGYEERMYGVKVSDCPYCGGERVVIHDFNDGYESPHSYRVAHVDEKESFAAECFDAYFAFGSVEDAVRHADMRGGHMSDHPKQLFVPREDFDMLVAETAGESGDGDDSSATQKETASLRDLFGILRDDQEKLEADVEYWLGSWTAFSVPTRTIREAVLGWLDRQAAITERECIDTRVNFAERIRLYQRGYDDGQHARGAASFPQRHEDDSREMLEADVWAGCEHLATAEREDVLVNVPWEKLLGWLDRAADIREREFVQDYCAECETAENAALKGDIEVLRNRLDKLQAENDELLAAHADDVERLDAMGEGELQKQVDEMQAEVEDVQDELNREWKEAEKWKARCAELQAELEARVRYPDGFVSISDMTERVGRLETENAELKAELAIANAKLAGKPDCELCDRTTMLTEIEALTVERDYWKQEVQYCMDAAYPKSHATTRRYAPDVMSYPDRKGCTTPSTLISDMIYGLRDESVFEWKAVLDERVKKAEAERDRYRELASELLDAAHNMQLIADRGLA